MPGQVVEGADVPQHANLVKIVHGFVCLFSNRLHIRGFTSQKQTRHDLTNRFIEWAVSIIGAVTILLQEIIFEELGNLKE